MRFEPRWPLLQKPYMRMLSTPSRSPLVKLFADENIDRQIIERLRKEGHEVLSVLDGEIGLNDEQVLTKANHASAILLTNDKDFGEAVYRQKKAFHGVILIRLAGLSSEKKAEIVCRALQEHSDLENNFTVIVPGTVRIRRKV